MYALILIALSLTSSSAAAFPIETVIPEVSGTTWAVVFDGTSFVTDVFSTPLDAEHQVFEEDLGSHLVDVAGCGFWSISGSLRWAGQLTMDTTTGVVSGVAHTALIAYELDTGDLIGLVYVPVSPVDAEGTISATLHSYYWPTPSSRQLTEYAFGFSPDYVMTSIQVDIDWRYTAVTNQIVFDAVGSVAIEDQFFDGWRAIPQNSISLGAVVVPEPTSSVLLGFPLAALGSRRRRPARRPL